MSLTQIIYELRKHRNDNMEHMDYNWKNSSYNGDVMNIRIVEIPELFFNLIDIDFLFWIQ